MRRVSASTTDAAQARSARGHPSAETVPTTSPAPVSKIVINSVANDITGLLIDH
jgi:hypothetical protein